LGIYAKALPPEEKRKGELSGSSEQFPIKLPAAYFLIK
jgi:hypothetical protein